VTAGRHLDMDHATFLSAGDLAGQSANIVLGTVQSSQPGDSTSLGSDPVTGAAYPPLPHTDFTVQVDQVMKGRLAVGSPIIVTLAGGVEDTGPVTVDGVPDLPTGSQQLFFLTAARSGKYYPLAGGAAIATLLSAGQYSLPGEVTGGAPITFDSTQLKATPQSIHLTVAASRSLSLDGQVQSGGIVRTDTGSGTFTLAGDALIQGSVLTLNVTVTGSGATGTISVDGTTLAITSARPVGHSTNGAHLVGKVSVPGSPSGKPRPFDLLVSNCNVHHK
jgi:hypothetical protein